ncbi:DNA-processing protein DprA [Aeromonas dhakensis]|uniref:DNA-processing protein DprA n=1 Tax=Aeromonas TaxID=642 RepID=UPI00191DDEB5|nr:MULTISPECIES: DNA-processing protein DprA [Aeromonas]MDD9308858.1 DNA-processing protein DprA [Aeromonas hydrophila]MBL0603216.1 DNA-protecting protein DprA [Aeromonas dhakensis]MBL0619827.1 DNA-protecting protein DprA [Aeromonas dhakensis]MBL0660761.1 DNA-protecting protein DprA [Aeromonas dhakensis]MED7773938.1 DNA-processing protein DprA [Aeromonas dhakensis]
MTLPSGRLALWLTLDAVTGIGPVTAARLLAHFGGDIAALFDSEDGTLRELGLQSAQIRQMRWPLPVVEQGLSWAAEPGNHLLCPDDPAYPPLLKEIPAAPLLLYCRGNLAALSVPQLAMVGTRHPTYAGKDNAARLCSELVGCGLAITSGLALGIDGICHQQALTNGGITLAVLGSGLDSLYPKRHQGLAEQILAQDGVLISELVPDKGPLAEHFPRRNRIISGLSLGTLVVEAAEQSGSLITARYALEQGRDVFAVPGAPQNGQALGCNKLIQQGAKLVLSAADIVEELPGFCALSHQGTDMSEQQHNSELPYADLLDNVDYETTSVDTVAERTQLPVEVVLGRLVELELAGAVMAVAGGYVRARRANHV